MCQNGLPPYILLAYILLAYILLAYILLAYILAAYILAAYILLASYAPGPSGHPLYLRGGVVAQPLAAEMRAASYAPGSSGQRVAGHVVTPSYFGRWDMLSHPPTLGDGTFWHTLHPNIPAARG